MKALQIIETLDIIEVVYSENNEIKTVEIDHSEISEYLETKGYLEFVYDYMRGGEARQDTATISYTEWIGTTDYSDKLAIYTSFLKDQKDKNINSFAAVGVVKDNV